MFCSYYPRQSLLPTYGTAVYLAEEKLDECIKECEAVAIGRENKAGVQMIAKAFLRMGNACAKKEDWNYACTCYKNSLRENHTADAQTKLNQAEKKVKEEKERQLIKQEEERKEQARQEDSQQREGQELQEAEDNQRQEEEMYKKEIEESVKEKDKGNDCYRKGDYDAALKHYNRAIRLNAKDAKIFSNRAATYIKKQQYLKALNDCNKSIHLDATLAKSYSRKGSIMLALNREYTLAAEAYQEALKIEPNNADHVMNLRKCREYADAEELRELALQDPEIRAILADPQMREILKSMQKDPKEAQEYFKDQQIVNQVQKLFYSGLLYFH